MILVPQQVQSNTLKKISNRFQKGENKRTDRRAGRAEGDTGYSFSALSKYFKESNYTNISKSTYETILDKTKSIGRAMTKDEFAKTQTQRNGSFNQVWDKDKNLDKTYEAYLQFVNDNSDKFGYTVDESGNTIKNTTEMSGSDFYNMLSGYDQDIKDNLMLDANGTLAQEYKRDQYGALEQYASSLDASLAASEMSAYNQIGQQQLQLENTIAEQRMKALKSGTTSAQLAAQSLQNMFAAQSGAAQVANNLMSNRLQNYNTIAQQRYGITQDLYNQINTNRTTYANAKAQLAAVAGSYAATVDQPYAQYDAYASLSQNLRDQMQKTYTYTGKIKNNNN